MVLLLFILGRYGTVQLAATSIPATSDAVASASKVSCWLQGDEGRSKNRTLFIESDTLRTALVSTNVKKASNFLTFEIIYMF